ncbi:MAG: diguanylate cyclase [Patescibacteria group bacterium]
MSVTPSSETEARFNRYPFSAKQFRDIYGVDFNQGNIAHNRAISIIENVFVDHGLARTIKPRDLALKIEKIHGIHMFNRTGLIHEILPHIIDGEGKHNGKDVHIVMFDVEGVKKMDNAGKEAADYALNRFASVLRNRAKALNKEGIKAFAGRYGGDEFALFLDGDVTEEKVQEINRSIMQILEDQNIRVPIKPHEDSALEFGGIRSKAKHISLPTDPIDRDIFIAYLKRNQIIEMEDIEKIKNRFDNDGERLTKYIDKLNKRASIYDESGAVTNDEKIAYLRMHHAEIGDMFDLVQSEEAKQNALTFVEQKMYSPLFNDVVYSFSHLEEHITEKKYSQVGWVEAKWIKEANARLSFFEGDLLMQKIYQTIKENIKDVDRGKITIANRAGAFMIGFEDGVSEGTIDKLKKLQSTTIEIRGQSVTLPIGVEVYSVEELEIGELKRKLRTEAEAKWYTSLMKYITAHEGNMDLLDLLSKRELPGNYSNRQFELIHAFFWQKDRGVDRCTKAITARDILGPNEGVYKIIKDKIEGTILPELSKEIDR